MPPQPRVCSTRFHREILPGVVLIGGADDRSDPLLHIGQANIDALRGQTDARIRENCMVTIPQPDTELAPASTLLFSLLMGALCTTPPPGGVMPTDQPIHLRPPVPPCAPALAVSPGGIEINFCCKIGLILPVCLNQHRPGMVGDKR